jgi:hypothetical protein
LLTKTVDRYGEEIGIQNQSFLHGSTEGKYSKE